MNTDQQVSVLLKRLIKANRAYHNGSAIMTDALYDQQLDKLKGMRKHVTDASLKSEVTSFIKLVGVKPDAAPVQQSLFGTELVVSKTQNKDVDLPVFMHSLQKIKNDDAKGLSKFIDFLMKVQYERDSDSPSKSVHLSISPKLDGSSFVLHYKNGKLLTGVTRGDGSVGKDKTSHAMTLAAAGVIPKKLKTWIMHQKLENVYVRGELIISLRTFKSQWAPEYDNPRNAIAGWLNANEPNAKLASTISFIAYYAYSREDEAYEIGYDNPEAPNERAKAIAANDDSQVPPSLISVGATLSHAGFTTYHKAPAYTFFASEGYTKSLQERMFTQLKKAAPTDDFPFEQDGIVIEPTSLPLRAFIEQTYPSKDGRPRWGRAFKFGASEIDNQESQETEVQRIEWNTSKSGALKPKVIIRPVSLNGATIGAVTGNNAQYLIDRCIVPNAKVVIVRSGGVIPQIVDVLTRSKNPAKYMAQKCDCGAPAIWVENTKGGKYPDLYCSEPHKCKYVQVNVLLNAIPKFQDGISSGSINKLYDAGMTSFLRVVQTKSTFILKIPGFGQSMADKMMALRQQITQTVLDKDFELLYLASGVFMRPGYSLAEANFAKIAPIAKKYLSDDSVSLKKLDKALAKAGIGQEARELFVQQYPKFLVFYAKLEKLTSN